MSERHTCEWITTGSDVATEAWQCAECGAVSATCIVTDTRRGEHPTGTSLLICQPCLDHERRVLDDIADALGHWQHQPRSIVPAIRYDRDRITGSWGEARQGINHPRDVVEVLWSWVAMWEQAGAPNVAGDAAVRLRSLLLWAAHHGDASVWDDYRTEMRQHRHHARRVAHLLPRRLAGPCIHCGGKLVRDWADEHWQPRQGERPEDRGLSDVVRCTGCAMTWGDYGRWAFAARHTLALLPQTHPEALVTIKDARAIWPEVPASTWRTWHDRDHERAKAGEVRVMPEHGWDVRGRAQYRVGDLDAMVRHRVAEGRDGRRASERMGA